MLMTFKFRPARVFGGAILGLLGSCFMLGSAHAQNNGLPNRDQSVVLLQLITTKGAECDLLDSWEVAAIRAMMEQEMSGWPTERRQAAADATAERLAETDCESPVVTTWIDAAKPNMQGEMLPGFLLTYKTIAEMEERPLVFTMSAVTLDTRPVVAAIDAKLAALEAEGATPEGGKPWPDYIERTTGQINTVIDGYMSADPDAGIKPDEVAALIAQAVLITNLWYEGDAESEEESE